MGAVSDYLEEHLTQAFAPQSLEILNESHLHAGHQPGFDGSGESHIRIRITSGQFEGMLRVKRHRMINELVQDDIDAGLHAVAIEARSPSETG